MTVPFACLTLILQTWRHFIMVKIKFKTEFSVVVLFLKTGSYGDLSVLVYKGHFWFRRGAEGEGYSSEEKWHLLQSPQAITMRSSVSVKHHCLSSATFLFSDPLNNLGPDAKWPSKTTTKAEAKYCRYWMMYLYVSLNLRFYFEIIIVILLLLKMLIVIDNFFNLTVQDQ